MNPNGSQANDCSSAELASGGINERIYVYNIDDVDNLMFQDDNRFDDTLIIDTIITSKAYYFIDCTNASYNENQDGDKHIHTLTLTVANSNPITEDTLNEAVNHRYLVAFRPKGAELYRVFGWKEGAGMSYTMDIDSDTNAYTITLSDESEYALMACLADNFNLAEKVFTPIFKPLYDISYCETSGGQRTGYCIASYVVKVNSAGQPLDEDNKLCYYSEKPQDAYKYQGLSDGDYNILGTYTDTASFDGVPVKIFDIERCPINAQGTISFSPNVVNLNSTTTTYQDITISAVSSQGSSTCVPWTVIEWPSEVSLSQTSGQTCGTITVFSNGIGLDGGRIVVRNNTTYEQAYIEVNVNIIKVNEEYTYSYGTTQFDIKPIVEPSTADYTYSIDRSGLTITKQSDGTLHFVVNNPSDQYQTYTLTLTHSEDTREKKYVAINLLGSNVDPVWRMMAQYCEEGTDYRWVVVEGQYECVGYDKHSVEKKQQSVDGINWTDVVPTETRIGPVVERDSEYCGYVPPIDYSTMYLTFEVLENSTTFNFYSPNSEPIQYSTDDGQTWTTLGIEPTITSGNKIMWKGLLTPETPITSSSTGIGRFTATGGRFKVYGNVMSLIANDNFETATTVVENQFKNLFQENTLLVDAEHLVLPATTLASGCYSFIFQKCTNLVTAPAILPATTLTLRCYAWMFLYCTSLVNAPQLPATTLANACYNAMFSSCSSLETAPVLPATTLTDSCYNSMFANCSSLNSITCLATDISATGCTLGWVLNVAASGTFTKASSMSSWTTGNDGIPNGWTVVNE